MMNPSIFKRLVIGYSIVMLLVLVFAGYTSLGLERLNRLTREVARVDSSAIGLIERLIDTLISQVRFEKKYLIARDSDFLNQFQQMEQHFLDDFSRLELLADMVETDVDLQPARGLYGHYTELFYTEILQLLTENPQTNLETVQQDRAIALSALNQRLRGLINVFRSDRDRKIIASGFLTARIGRVATITAILVIVSGTLVAFFTTRSISRPVRNLQAKAREIAGGRFEQIENISGPPEIQALAHDFNRMCERLNEIDRMKQEFISHVSHELRTPLTAIRESSAMLLDGIHDSDPDKRRELLEITHDECERLIVSVNQILDLSRMEAHMAGYRFRQADLPPLIRKVVLMLAPLAGRERLDLEIEPLPELPMLKLDPERIEQVLKNLLGNAIKFTPEGGRIVVSVRQNGQVVETRVTDTGCGIATEHLETIFDKYQRVERNRHPAGGTGLGLAIARHIISDHGGTIWATSENGCGSTFCFTLPVWG